MKELKVPLKVRAKKGTPSVVREYIQNRAKKWTFFAKQEPGRARQKIHCNLRSKRTTF